MIGLKKRILIAAVATAFSLSALAQHTVTGTVTDETGEPLIGVSVYLDGKSVATTNIDGVFTLPSVKPSQKIKLVYVGYDDKVIQAGESSDLKIVMDSNTQQLDEVMVIGYGTMKKSDLTGSVSSVSSAKLNEKGATSVIANLQGSVPGVSITQSTGRTGGSFNIEIRGKNSINGDQSPLYVVDGVTCTNIDFLNPQDIERIDVLKDASSTAIYGSRATAGVVIVTTKSGSNAGMKAQKPTVSYSGYYGVKKVTNMPEFMSADQFYNFRFMKFLNVTGGDMNNGQPVWINDDLDRCLLKDGVSGIYRMLELLETGKTYDWKKFVLQDGHQQNHYLAISGASDKTQYHIGMGYSGEKGIYKNDKEDKFTLKVSVDTEVNRWLSAGASVNIARTSQDYASDPAVQYAFRINPFMQPYDDEGNIHYMPGDKTALNTDMYQFTSQISPLIYMQDQASNRLTWTGLGNVYLQANILKGLQFRTILMPTFTHSRYGFYEGTLAGQTQNTAKRHTSQSEGYTWDNQLTFDRMFGKNHHLNVMGLISYAYNKSELGQFEFNKVLDGTYWWNLGSTDQGYNYKDSKTEYSENSLMSYALRANYIFMNRYMFTGTIRWDGSSRFAKGKRWGSFPSAAFAWRLSEESFMEATRSWMSNMKLRISYGVTGNNSSVGDYATMLTMTAPVYYPFGASYSQGLTINGIVDKALKWEKSHEVNFGVDFGFLGERIRGTVDIYNKKSKDLLYQVQLPLEAGGTSVTTNIGSVRNRGVEVSLTTTNIASRDWSWETTFTFARNRNKVLEINGTGNYYSGSNLNNLFIGLPFANVYDYEWDGIVTDRLMTVPDNEIATLKGFTPGDQVREYEYYYKCYGLVEGNPIIKDRNGDGKFTDDDKKVYNSEPKWTGSFTSNLRWKDIDFSFSIYAKQGYSIFSNFYNEYLNIEDRGRTKLNMDWYIPAGTLISCEGQTPDGQFINPVYQETTHYGNYPFPNNGCSNGGTGTQYWMGHTNSITNGSFVKVKHITLGYSFPRSLISKFSCSELRLYCTVTNPFVFTKYKGYDPEWAGTDLKNDGPSTITWQVGANIRF